MTDEQALKLLGAIEAKAAYFDKRAARAALNYVVSGADPDRVASTDYSNSASIWREARGLINAARGGQL